MRIEVLLAFEEFYSIQFFHEQFDRLIYYNRLFPTFFYEQIISVVTINLFLHMLCIKLQ